MRHRLAESLVAIEAADAAARRGLADDGSPLAAALAKAIAGRSARTVARHCQQVLAGIGFTTEHDLHRYVRRTSCSTACSATPARSRPSSGEQLLAPARSPSSLPL